LSHSKPLEECYLSISSTLLSITTIYIINSTDVWLIILFDREMFNGVGHIAVRPI
jgi:hypothetical protein